MLLRTPTRRQGDFTVWKQIAKFFVACIRGALIDVVVECAKVVQVSPIDGVSGYMTQLTVESSG